MNEVSKFFLFFLKNLIDLSIDALACLVVPNMIEKPLKSFVQQFKAFLLAFANEVLMSHNLELFANCDHGS